MNPSARPQIAFWFRYGPAEHTELFHCIPQIIEQLAQECAVHYYGLRSAKPVPALIQKHARLHLLPLAVNRASTATRSSKPCSGWRSCRCSASTAA